MSADIRLESPKHTTADLSAVIDTMIDLAPALSNLVRCAGDRALRSAVLTIKARLSRISPVKNTLMTRTKAVGMLSGGLDSILAFRLMLDQGIDVCALNFKSPFCTCTSKGCQHQATKVAHELNVPIKVVPTGQDYIDMVKHPRHGYGRNMNPCLDCRVFTFSRARQYAREIGAAFVFSGEVLGERPMSQHMPALKLIEKESGLEGILLRPLSAHLLEPTVPELQGLVDRTRLLAIRGRSRKPQIALAAELGVNDYPCPAGGCLLTDRLFAARLREAFEHNDDTPRHMQMLRIGRHFRLPSRARVIVGRDELENAALRNLVRPEDTSLEPVDVVGPLTVLFNSTATDDVRTSARLCARFSDGREQPEVTVECGAGILRVAPLSEADTSALRIGG